jgi:hypothetical protein
MPSCILSGALIALINRQDRSGTKIVLSISTPCQCDLTRDFVYPSCSTIQENIIFDHTNDWFSFGSSYPNWGMSSLTLEFEKVFHSEHLIELDQEDWVMERNTSRVMKHNLILQEAMSPTHERKSCIGNRGIFLLSIVSISSFLHGQCIYHRSCAPSFINVGMRFFSRGEGL